MTGTRKLIVAGALLLSAGVAGSLALAAGDDHGKHAAPAAKTATKAHGDESPKAAKPEAKSARAAKSDTSKTEAKAETKSEAKTESTKTESTKATKNDEAKADAPKADATKSVSEAAPSTPDAALEALKAGNERWVSGKVNAPNTSTDRRADVTANGQHPFATIYTCADSRLPVERIFDRGVGDVFVLRIAGNVIGEHATGTIEYGVEHLHTPLLVVMGHTKCGAVAAACGGGHVGGSIDSLLTEIKPAVDRAKAQNPDATDAKLVEFAVNENVWQSVFELLKTSEIVRNQVTEGKIKIVGAVCDISTGKVQFLGEHPWQSQLMQAFAGSTAPALAKETTKSEAKESHAGTTDEHDAH